MAKLPPKRRAKSVQVKKRRVHKGMVTLYHGTTAAGKRNILKHGFQNMAGAEFHKGGKPNYTSRGTLPITLANNVAYASHFGRNVRGSSHVVRITLPKRKAQNYGWDRRGKLVEWVGREGMIKKNSTRGVVRTKTYTILGKIPRKYIR